MLVALYDGKPVPKVIDFGVAKAAGQSLTDKTLVTGFGAIIGTLEYMSPEQAEINQLDIDTRSDIYSLGVLLYELLAGSPPFSRKELEKVGMLEMLRVIREQEPSRPSAKLSTAEGLPTLAANRGTEPVRLTKLLRGELDWIVMRALEKDRGRRYETANGFAMDVQRYLADEPVQACPPSTMYRLRKFARRNMRVFVPAFVVALALVTGTIFSAWQAIRATNAEGLAQKRLEAETEARKATRVQLTLTEQAEDGARRRLYRSLVSQARANRLSRRIGQRFKGLDALTEATKMARDLKLLESDYLELRNEAIACLSLPDLRVIKEWDGRPVGTWWVDFDSTFERYARADRRGTTSVRRVADDVELCRIPGMGTNGCWHGLSPDGRFLARYGGPRFELWRLADSRPERIDEGPAGSFAYSPDSRRLARAMPDGSVCLYDLLSAKEVRRLEHGPRAVRAVAFNPKGDQLAVAHGSGVQIYDLETGRVVTELSQTVTSGELIAWHPAGRSLAVACSDRVIRIWDVARRKVTTRLEGHNSSGIFIAYNNAGNLLASVAWDGLVRLWDPRTGKQLFQTKGSLGHVRFSADDRLLAGSVGTKILLWEVASPIGYNTLAYTRVPPPVRFFQSAIHPNGRLLAAGMQDGIHLWDLVDRTQLGWVKTSQVTGVLFEPSGRADHHQFGGRIPLASAAGSRFPQVAAHRTAAKTAPAAFGLRHGTQPGRPRAGLCST